jgi:tetratricopeptide (TPR) repeat protein
MRLKHNGRMALTTAWRNYNIAGSIEQPIRAGPAGLDFGKSGCNLVKKSSRPQIVSLVALLVFAGGVLAYRTARKAPELLYLSDSVELTTPPPLPGSDLAVVQLACANLLRARQAADQSLQGFDAQYNFGSEALAAGDPLEALPALQQAMRLTRQPSADLMYDLASSQNMLGMCREARVTYRSMQHVYPRDARAYLEESRTLELMNDRADSVQALERGLAASADDDVAGRVRLINMLDSDGGTAEALAAAQTLEHHLPADAQGVILLVHLLIKNNRPAEAYPLLADLISKEPGNPQAHYDMGGVLSNPLFPRKDLPAAENELLLAVRCATQNSTVANKVFSRLGEFYMDQGKYRQCAYISLQLLADKPDTAAARLCLASSFAHLGDQAAAAQQSAIASELIRRDQEISYLKSRAAEDPTNPLAKLNLGLLFEKYGQFGQALTALEAAYALAPDTPKIKTEMTELCGRIGMPVPQLHAEEHL